MSRPFPWTALLVFLGLVTAFPAVASAATPPPADAVFRLGASRGSDGGLALTWDIGPGHTLYRDRIDVRTDAGQAVPLALPAGEKKTDPTFGTTRVYHGQVAATIAPAALPASGALHVTYQGCAERGICYPPEHQRIDLATLTVTPDTMRPRPAPAPAAEPAGGGAAKPDGSLAARLTGGLPAMVLRFFGFGLLLAFTPCVFPMVPILAGMLAKGGQTRSARQGGILSGAYVLAMALAYAALGVVAAWSGRNLQVMLQTPLAIGLMSLVFVALALSMFGLYDLTLPAAWTARLSRATGGGGQSIGGAALLGFGSALIVGPCVTPPLAAALLYVAQTGDVARGAAALFALGLGMGIPLLVFGTFGGRLLPKPGAWLVAVKEVFGFLFLGLAIWMLGRVLPGQATQGLFGGVAIAAGLWFGLLRSRGYAMRLAGSATALVGVFLVAGSLGLFPGLCPLAACADTPAAATEATSAFSRTVRTSADFDAAMAEARAKGQPILVDFRADWCVVCREIDREVMADPAVRARLRNVSILRVDVTADTPETRRLMQRFDVMGPPTMLFVDAHTGREIDNTRSVGAVSAEQFRHTLWQTGA